MVASAELLAHFYPGEMVGELARSYAPGGEHIDLPYWETDRRIDATRAAIADGKSVIYEAGFRADGVFVSVDILHTAPRGRAAGRSPR